MRPGGHQTHFQCLIRLLTLSARTLRALYGTNIALGHFDAFQKPEESETLRPRCYGWSCFFLTRGYGKRSTSYKFHLIAQSLNWLLTVKLTHQHKLTQHDI